jgi:hypothetical protein
MTPQNMDEQLSSLMRYSATDRVYDDPQQTSQKETKPNRPGTPRLTLTFKTEPELDIHVQAWHGFSFILTRDVDDPQRQACIIHLDPVEDGFGRVSCYITVNPTSCDPSSSILTSCPQNPSHERSPRQIHASNNLARAIAFPRSCTCHLSTSIASLWTSPMKFRGQVRKFAFWPPR